jgi:hypothetical protein
MAAMGWAADEALVAGADVVEVSAFGDQVDFGERQAAAGLFEVNAAANAALGAFFDLVVGGFVLDVVVFGEVDEVAVAQDVEGRRDWLRGRRFRRRRGVRSSGRAWLCRGAGLRFSGGKAVEDHLVETDAGSPLRV